jgi:hypothetical protein
MSVLDRKKKMRLDEVVVFVENTYDILLFFLLFGKKIFLLFQREKEL